jgi:endoglucanase
VRRHVTLFAAALLIAGPPVAVAALAAASDAGAATAGCAVTYTANTWNTGFTADIKITNLGDPVTAWTLGFSFPGDQHVTGGWSATYSQTGRAVTARSVDYNGALATGASTGIGFQATYTGTNAAPAAFTLNGGACTGAPSTGTPTPTPTATTAPPPPGTAPDLTVSGNRLVTGTGATYRLLGVNRSGGEFACIQGNGMWNGPMDQASVTAIRSWKVRTVRVPLNEECWLGTADVPAGGYGGAQYQQAVKDYVALLLANGITPLLELHWNYGQYTGPSAGCADVKATCQKPMPDAQYAPQFWTGVATAFKDTRIVLDLFNEPYPERATGSAASGWKCWRDGGTCAGIPYQVADSSRWSRRCGRPATPT